MTSLLSRIGPARIAAVATFIFITGVAGTRPLVPLHGVTLGIGAAELGVLVAVFALVSAFLTTTYGRWLDRRGSIGAMIASAAVTAFGLLLPALFPDRTGLYLSQLIAGSGMTGYILAGQKFAGQLSGDLRQRERNVAQLTMCVALGGLVGPPVAGLIGDTLGFLVAFSVLAIVSLCASVPLLFLLREEGRRRAAKAGTDPAPGPAGQSGFAPLRVFGYHPYLGRSFLISALVLMGKDLYIAYFPLYAIQVGMSATVIGAMIALHNAGAVAVRVFMLPLARMFGKNLVILVTVVASGLFFLAMPLSEDIRLLAALSLALGLSLGLGQPLAMTTSINLAPRDKVGEVLGFRLSINRITQVLAPLSFAAVAGLTGVAGIFFVIGGTMLAGAFRIRIPDTAEVEAQQAAPRRDTGRSPD